MIFCSTVYKQYQCMGLLRDGRDMSICIFICVCTKYHIRVHLFHVIVLYLDQLYAKLLSTHGPNLAYCAIFLNDLVINVYLKACQRKFLSQIPSQKRDIRVYPSCHLFHLLGFRSCKSLLSCQPRMTLTSCFDYNCK